MTVGFSNICACYLHLYFKKLRSHPQPGPSRATIPPSPLGILPMGFLSFPCRGGATTTTPRKTVQTTFCTVICMFSTKSSKSRVFWSVFAWFCNGNLHICHHKSVPKHNFLQCFKFPCLPKPLKTPLFTLFSSNFPCWPTQTYIQKILQQCFFNSVLQYFPSKTP